MKKTLKKQTYEKGTYEVYWNKKGEMILQLKPTFSLIKRIKKMAKKNLKNLSKSEIKKDGKLHEEIVFKILKSHKFKMIKAKNGGKWIKFK